MPTQRKRLLIVDDDAALCRTLKRALEPLDLVVMNTPSADGAMEQIRDHVFDVVLLDLGLPDRSGMDVLRDFVHSSARFVIITADETKQALLEAVKARAFDYIQKPFRIEQVVSAVERALKTDI